MPKGGEIPEKDAGTEGTPDDEQNEKDAEDNAESRISDDVTKGNILTPDAINDLVKSLDPPTAKIMKTDIDKLLSGDDAANAQAVVDYLSDPDVSSTLRDNVRARNFEDLPTDKVGNTPTQDQLNAFKKYADIKSDAMGKVISKLDSRFKKILDDAKGKTTLTKDLVGDLNNTFKDVMKDNPDLFSEKNMEDLNDKFLKNALDKWLKDSKEGKQVEKKNTTRNSFKDALKFLLALISIGTAIGLIYFLFLYAEEHSGCQLITCNENQLPYSQSIVCASSDQATVFNPNNGIIDFNNVQCQCQKQSQSKLYYLTDACDTCTNDTVNKKKSADIKKTCNTCESCGEPNPWIQFFGNPPCKNTDTFNPPYSYYRWSIMSPFDALGNLGNGIVNGTGTALGGWINLIIKLAIALGIIFGILLVLFIIYKIVSHRGQSKTIDIEMNGKQVANSFGRLRNYAYAGRCNAFGNFNF